ncbi:putative exonuclease 3'-5' domain-containing protein 1 [Apostichopus japonicus]|uniref:Putative exonuclease 3'-5' domain-containing protein 1 n=1 Tax=Stichopus japonicus TaxID=307972 RepID=A0A2G8LI45_STIJA|nr:putative exonuclease 3'-5' domain-containing protein 1 [Apostichopus japonicus]
MAAYAGCRVKILTDEGEYSGCVHALEQNSKRLTLDDVALLPGGKKVQGLRHFFGDEIISLEVIGENVETVKKPTKKSHDTSTPYQLLPPGVPLPVTVISEAGEQFQEMVSDIWKDGIFAVAFFGSGYERFGKLSLILIQTLNNTFVIDAALATPAVFVEGLGSLLETNEVVKVLHDCRFASDLLFHQFSIKMANVFDTQVADLMITKQKDGELPQLVPSLPDCLLAHLGADFQHVFSLNQIESSIQPNDWQQRPLRIEFFNFAVESVKHLLLLRKSLLIKLLAEFNVAVDVYLSTERNSSQQGNTVTKGKAKYLPKEFRKNWKFKLPALMEAELSKSSGVSVLTDNTVGIAARVQNRVSSPPTEVFAGKLSDDRHDKEDHTKNREGKQETETAERPEKPPWTPSGDNNISEVIRWQRGRGRGVLVHREPHRNERFKAEATNGPSGNVTFRHRAAVDFPTSEEVREMETKRNQALRRKGEMEEDTFSGD